MISPRKRSSSAKYGHQGGIYYSCNVRWTFGRLNRGTYLVTGWMVNFSGIQKQVVGKYSLLGAWKQFEDHIMAGPRDEISD